jgi:hypothetical protein
MILNRNSIRIHGYGEVYCRIELAGVDGNIKAINPLSPLHSHAPEQATKHICP